MQEAVEIAKLRLFLKLAAEAEYDRDKANLGLEPLPDIDFNIRSGNSLVGFVSMAAFEKSANVGKSGQALFDLSGGLSEEIRESARIVQKANEAFKEAQDESGHDYQIAKQELKKRLNILNDKMNIYLARTYGITEKKTGYKQWLESHQPFHWIAEFYGIIEQGGGFDVIIGNPPYLESNQINYTIYGLETIDTKAVHAMFIENSEQLMNEHSAFSMIVPLSLVSTQRMQITQNILERNKSVWYSNYAWRPGKLFDTVNRALTIFIAISQGNMRFSTNYQKWYTHTRALLFDNVTFISVEKLENHKFWIPKVGNSIENILLSKILLSNKTIINFTSKIGKKIFYRTTGGLYWKIFTNFSPKFNINGNSGSSSRETHFTISKEYSVYVIIAILSSNLYWWWYTLTSNLRDLNPSDILQFPILDSILHDQRLLQLGQKYVNSLKKNSSIMPRHQQQTGHTQTQSFKVQKSKLIIDQIDYVISEHYKFTEEEFDYIINYDIKYRMEMRE